MQQHHVGVLSVDPVELVPDQAVVVEVEAAGDGDLWASRHQHLGLGPAFGGEKVSAVDHGRGQRTVIDHRSCARAPGGVRAALELVGGLVAEEFHAVAAFDQRLALAGEAFQLDRADFRAILFPLAAFLRLLVVVELAFDPADGAVEDVDRRPQQVFEVGFEAGITQRHRQCVEDVGHRAGDDLGVGHWPRVGFVLERAVAVELEFGEDVIGGG